eukprot:scaffold287_cov337-Pavlova_lutheri.AAC.204
MRGKDRCRRGCRGERRVRTAQRQPTVAILHDEPPTCAAHARRTRRTSGPIRAQKHEQEARHASFPSQEEKDARRKRTRTTNVTDARREGLPSQPPRTKEPLTRASKKDRSSHAPSRSLEKTSLRYLRTLYLSPLDEL